MNGILRHGYGAQLCVRSDDDGDGRTVYGIAVPFDTPTEIWEWGDSYTEEFARGAFAKTISERGPGRVKFLAQHEHSSWPLGPTTLLREDKAGLYAEFRVSKTQRGDEALELINDDALDGLSICFVPITDTWNEDRTHVTRKEVKLNEISLVTFPAYEDATVSGVRGSLDHIVQTLATWPVDRPIPAALAATLRELADRAESAESEPVTEPEPVTIPAGMSLDLAVRHARRLGVRL